MKKEEERGEGRVIDTKGRGERQRLIIMKET